MGWNARLLTSSAWAGIMLGSMALPVSAVHAQITSIGTIDRKAPTVATLPPPVVSTVPGPGDPVVAPQATIDPRATTSGPSVSDQGYPAPADPRAQIPDRGPRISDYVDAQPVIQPVRKVPPKRVAFTPRILEVQGGRPIPFERYPMVDPETGQPMGPDDIIEFPRGETARAGDYFPWLNKFEERLNALGYSSRDMEHADDEDHEFVVNRFAVDDALINRQLANFPEGSVFPQKLPNGTRLDPPGPSEWARHGFDHGARAADMLTMPPVGQFPGALLDENRQAEELRREELVKGATGPIVNFGQCKALKDPRLRRTGNFELGDPSVVEGHINSWFALKGLACDPAYPDGDRTWFRAEAGTEAGGSVFNNDIDLFRVVGTAEGDNVKDRVNARLELFIAGQNIFSLPASAPAKIDLNNGYSADLGEPSFSALVSILDLINIDYTITIKGNAGFDYELGLRPTSVRLGIMPHVEATACADAGIGIGTQVIGVTVGVGGCLLIVRAGLRFTLDGGVGPDPASGRIAAKGRLFAGFDVGMLDGQVDVWAQYYAPCFGIPPWCRHRATFNIFKWDGVSFNQTLIDERISVPIL